MSSDRNLGVQLLRQGYSYDDVRSKLKVAKSTINSWFVGLPEREKMKIKKFRIKNWRKSIKTYQTKRHEQILAKEKLIQEISAREISSISKKELLLLGTSLYWAEGSKTDRWHLQFSNSDPEMIGLMMRFFREICRVDEEEFYFQMILHKNIREESALNYWSHIVEVPKKQFKKPCYSLSKSSKRVRNRNKLPFGTLQIRIFGKKLTHQVYGFILGLKQAGVVQQ